ncbi:class F sortase [Streptomyces sp. NPDC048324]|uniref:class F sortase n=1 Tax=Streptomyces sp. NPDC048324 TaxID=3157205 RepID=UPI00342B21ED
MAAPSSPPSGDDPAPAASSRTSPVMIWAAAGLLLAIALLTGHDPAPGTSRAPRADQPAVSAPPARAAPSGSSAGPHLPWSRPVRLLIPKIGVDAPFTDLSLGDNGQLQPPPAADTNLVGWYADGAAPGETGTAVIAGHVDTKTSAAVFAGLSELRKDDVFSVERADGRTATFRVDSAETFSKADFPSDRVYGDTPRAEARLITCAGDYDRTVRDYTDNLVVFAHLV